MRIIEFQVITEHIDLLQLLKAAGIAMSGGEAKMFVNDAMITVNDHPESRKRRKLRVGDVVVFDDQITITLIKST